MSSLATGSIRRSRAPPLGTNHNTMAKTASEEHTNPFEPDQISVFPF